MEIRRVTCDQCDCDLTETDNSIDYRLDLINTRIPSKGGLVTLMMIHPHLDRDHHFCGVSCLKKWVELNL